MAASGSSSRLAPEEDAILTAPTQQMEIESDDEDESALQERGRQLGISDDPTDMDYLRRCHKARVDYSPPRPKEAAWRTATAGSTAYKRAAGERNKRFTKLTSRLKTASGVNTLAGKAAAAAADRAAKQAAEGAAKEASAAAARTEAEATEATAEEKEATEATAEAAAVEAAARAKAGREEEAAAEKAKADEEAASARARAEEAAMAARAKAEEQAAAAKTEAEEDAMDAAAAAAAAEAAEVAEEQRESFLAGVLEHEEDALLVQKAAQQQASAAACLAPIEFATCGADAAVAAARLETASAHGMDLDPPTSENVDTAMEVDAATESSCTVTTGDFMARYAALQLCDGFGTGSGWTFEEAAADTSEALRSLTTIPLQFHMLRTGSKHNSLAPGSTLAIEDISFKGGPSSFIFMPRFNPPRLASTDLSTDVWRLGAELPLTFDGLGASLQAGELGVGLYWSSRGYASNSSCVGTFELVCDATAAAIASSARMVVADGIEGLMSSKAISTAAVSLLPQWAACDPRLMLAAAGLLRSNTVCALLARGAPVTATDGFVPVCLGCGHSSDQPCTRLNTVLPLIQARADVNAIAHLPPTASLKVSYLRNWVMDAVQWNSGYFGTPLHGAASHGDIETVHLLLMEGADVNISALVTYSFVQQPRRCLERPKPSTMAIGRLPELLCERFLHMPPLVVACAAGHVDIALSLLEAGASPNPVRSPNVPVHLLSCSPLHAACLTGPSVKDLPPYQHRCGGTLKRWGTTSDYEHVQLSVGAVGQGEWYGYAGFVIGGYAQTVLLLLQWGADASALLDCDSLYDQGGGDPTYRQGGDLPAGLQSTPLALARLRAQTLAARWLSNADGSIIWRYGDQNMWQRLQELMGSLEASLRDAGEPIGFPTDSMDLYSAYLVPSDDSDTEYQLPERIQLA